MFDKLLLFGLVVNQLLVAASLSAEQQSPPRAYIDGTGSGWHALTEEHFVNVNGADDTWSWQKAVLRSTGKPIGVMRSRKQYTNFELVAEWKHLESGGNSGIFVWTSQDAIDTIKANGLPQCGIEIQILDNGFADKYEKENGKKGDWFTTHGDVFPVGTAKMMPFAPTSPGGERSFPRKNLSKSAGEWNHYYVRCINGEVRLWVNGEEVSGGNDCEPRSGYLCLESEGAPIEFKGLRIRELP
jgi:hypothetical protein